MVCFLSAHLQLRQRPRHGGREPDHLFTFLHRDEARREGHQLVHVQAGEGAVEHELRGQQLVRGVDLR